MVGVDGITREEYGQGLEDNLQDLQALMKSTKYRHQAIRCGHPLRTPQETGITTVAIVATELH